MGIPNQQIGWSQKAKLLWQISKQIERLTQVMGGVTFPSCPECPECPATIDIYSQELSFPINFTSLVFSCDGSDVGPYRYTSATVNDMSELVLLFNTEAETNVYGTFSASTSTVLKLTTQQIVKDVLCPQGTLSLNVFND